jgi:hypothetical protein
MDDRRLDEETWQAVDLFSRNSMKTFQELADEALARSRAGASLCADHPRDCIGRETSFRSLWA